MTKPALPSPRNPVFYDCEASCLGGYPIEIGWAYVDEATGEIVSESHLIRPPVAWNILAQWDPDAQKLHGIEYDDLLKHGSPPAEIAARMNAALAGRDLHSDSPPDDEAWLRKLYEAAGIVPGFTVSATHAAKVIALKARQHGIAEGDLTVIKAQSAAAFPKRHRACARCDHACGPLEKRRRYGD